MELDRVKPCSMEYLKQFNTENGNKIGERNRVDVSKATKVHVNPNFRNGKSLVIHVNPRMQQNRKIHVNPKMMKDVVPVAKTEVKVNVSDRDRASCESRLSPETVPIIQKSIHVNPKLMNKFSSISRENTEVTIASPKPILTNKPRSANLSKINENSVPNNKIPIKISSPRLLALSRRKLVRVGSNVKTTTIIPSPSMLKRLNKKPLLSTKVNTKKSAIVRSKFSLNKNTYKLNAYKIDRTALEQTKSKKIRIPDVRTRGRLITKNQRSVSRAMPMIESGSRFRNVNKGLVAIGGIMYQSSRTQLVRSGTSSSTHKRKSSVANTKSDTFVMAKNGKKLHRLHTAKEGSNVTRYMISRNSLDRSTIVKKVPNSIVQSSHKNVISYKAKQRSLQILRDKLRKNYIPCLLYRRFGYCAKHAKGTCPKLHDKKQVALCKNFLQGKCLLDDCPLSHDIGPEKMPTCKYFLEGCCIRDPCPYLHVKVSANTPLCAQFLRGYCAEGNKCKQRHTYICPDFDKSGKCAKGKYCPYPHKLKSNAALVSKRSVKNTRRSSSSKPISKNAQSKVVETGEDSRKRYYDKTSPTDKQLVEMRENILKQMQCMKASLGISKSSDGGINENCGKEKIDDDEHESDCNFDERPKRAPLGPLPAYIPIN